MITCKKCGTEFQSIWKEAYPGGAESCGTIMFWALAQFMVGAILCTVAFYAAQNVVYFFAGLFILISILKIASIPDNMRVILDHGGNECPNCATPNQLRWYN